jgi:hypothetical protein
MAIRIHVLIILWNINFRNPQRSIANARETVYIAPNALANVASAPNEKSAASGRVTTPRRTHESA